MANRPANREEPYIPSVPPESFEEFRWWMHNEFIMIQQALEQLRVTNATRNNIKWDDLRFPVNSLQVNPTNNLPSATYTLETKMWAFEDTYSSTANLMFIAQFPHAWKIESSLGPHIHTININSLSGDIRWGLTYRWVSPDEVVHTASTVYVTQTVAGTADKSELVKFPHIPSEGENMSAMILGNVFRLGGDAADTATGTIALAEFDIHYQQDADGSREEYTK